MRYNKQAMTRPEMPKPELGWHVMRIKKELPAKNGSQHSFILENDKASFFFNCWLHDVPDFAQACNVHLTDDGSCDTSEFVDKWVRVFFEDRESKGKTYRNVTNFESVSPDQVPEEIDPSTDTNDIPF